MRIKKLMEQKKKNNSVFTGVRGFRCSIENNDEFSTLEKEFGNQLAK